MFTRRLITLCTPILFCMLYAEAQESELKITTQDVSCFGGNDGKLEINWVGDKPDSFSISVADTNGNALNVYTQTSTFPVKLEKLSSSQYNIILSIAGTMKKYSPQIDSPAKLTGEKIKVVQMPSANNCDGILRAGAQGGTAPYEFHWNDSSNEQADHTNACLNKIYRCKINDKNNCGPVVSSIPMYPETIEGYLLNKQK